MRVVSFEVLKDCPCIVPLIGRRVPAGFPSPADDYLDGELDLCAYLIERPASTFMLTVDGPSMEAAGIMSGDKIAVDRSITPRSGMIVVGIIHGDMTVKRLQKMRDGRHALVAEPAEDNQERYPPFIINEGAPFEIWGVVTGVVRRMVP